MEKDILSRIGAEGLKLSKGQKRIAKYIREHYDKAAFMTAGKLGSTVGVSESTVVRFAGDLGYEGYPEMRKAIQEMIRSRLTSVQRIRVAREAMEGKNLLDSVMLADADKLNDTLHACDRARFRRAVEAIDGARHVYIVGMRSSACLASFLGFYLNLLRENVHVVEPSGSEIYEQILRIREGDVFIGISFPRYSSGAVKPMRYAKSCGATVIGLTDGEASPFVGLADILLYAKSDMMSFVDSLVAPMSLINALIVAVGSHKDETLADTFQRLESVWEEYDVYEHAGS